MESEDNDAQRAARRRRALRELFVDLTPLRASPAFARLWAGTSVAQIGAQITVVAVGLHIYELTRSTLAVSFVALWALGPMIVAGLVGGSLADRYDRRAVALLSAVAAWLSIGTMAGIAFAGVTQTWPYYLLAAINAAAATILGTTRGAILPRLLPAQLLPAAAALNGITMGLAVTAGPALAGVLVATVGVPWTYFADAVLFLGAFIGISGLPALRPEGGRAVSGIASIIGSLRFLRRAPNVRATFVFDLIAMILGTPRVVFPAAGAVVLGGGAITVGLLTASFAAGALICSIFSGPLGGIRRQGRAVTLAIVGYGAGIAAFGMTLLVTMLSADGSWQDPLSAPESPRLSAILCAALFLAVAGAADNISAIFRTTILQTAVPDDMRGRMQGIFTIVVTGGPRVGDLLAGALAALIALWAPALVGGLLMILLMIILLRVWKGFQRYDARHPEP